LCDGWCGWPFLLPAFGLVCYSLHSTSPDMIWNPHASVPVLSLTKDFSPLPEVTCLLLSGSSSWFQQVWDPGWLRLCHVLWSCTDDPPVVSALPFSTVLVHRDVGGILDGSFLFFSSCSIVTPPAPSVSQRALHHILGVAVRGGIAVPAPPRTLPPLPDFVAWGNALLASNPLSLVRCRSVFSPTKWVLRPLTAQELLAVFDIPQQERTTAAQYNSMADLPFLHRAPLKVLHAALARWEPTKLSTPPPLISTPVLAPLAQAYPKDCFGHMAVLAADAVAAKADDAAAPTDLWDHRVWNGLDWTKQSVLAFEERFGRGPLDSIRHLVLRVWRRNVRVSFMGYMKEMYGDAWASCTAGAKDRAVGRDCLWRIAFCDWWDWPRGSTLFFWRWPRSIQHLARDGHPVWWLSAPPRYMKPQPRERDPEIREKVGRKIQNVREKRYILPGTVANVTSYFAVPKGEADIRLVYDATRSGLNKCIWVPSFVLPPTEAMTDRLTGDSWMSDHDIGEMFLNFPMHESIQPFSGIDIRPYCFPDSSRTHIERWVRCMMGWVAAPYITTQSLALAKEVIFGDRLQSGNPYQWETVVLNLPGQRGYTPTLPWVRRVTRSGEVASDCPTYVDDARIIGASHHACLHAGHTFATKMCYLGIQVAARKVRPPSQAPGAWAGAVALVGVAGVGVTCLPERWIKVQAIVHDTLREVQSGAPLDHKVLEQRRGFLNHIQRVFPAMTPFLKGFHLTLDGWRPGRDEDMWKFSHPLADLDWDPPTLHQPDPPSYVAPAP